jgi:Peptidase M15
MADDNSIWTTLGKLLLSFLSNKAEGNVGVSVSIPLIEKPEEPTIKWDDPLCAITPHFMVGDAIALHSWNRLANESDGLTDDGKAKLVVLCNKMEEIRKILGCPISVHCMFRSQKYNQEVVKAIPNDVHAQFLAVDFDCNGHHTIDEVHAILEPLLEQLGVRMERNTPSWIHIDMHPVVHQRYFTA